MDHTVIFLVEMDEESLVDWVIQLLCGVIAKQNKILHTEN